jgi:hypothetical protein
MKTSNALQTLVGVAAISLPLLVNAASTYTSGSGSTSASAQVNFSIVIPRTLYLRVGTGSTYPGTQTTNANIDTITFSPAVGSVGNGTAVAGTGGDLGTTKGETAAIITNSTSVSLTAMTTGALTDANGDTIPFTTITTSQSALTSGYTLLQAPALPASGTSTAVTLTAAAGKTIAADAQWAFSYANATVPPAGTYGAGGGTNGLVTYTATVL